jgi:hypothetical protein
MSENVRFVFDGLMYHFFWDSDYRIIPDLITVRTREQKLKKSEANPLASVIANYLFGITDACPNLSWVDEWDSEFN